MAKSKQFLTQAGRHFGNAESELKAIISSVDLGSKASRIFNENLSTATEHMRFSKVLFILSSHGRIVLQDSVGERDLAPLRALTG